MFDSGKIAGRALLRADEIRAQKKRRQKRLNTVALLTVCLALAVCLALLPGRYMETGAPTQAQANAPLLWEDAGGYVLTCVICFVLGAAVTLLCLRLKKKK